MSPRVQPPASGAARRSRLRVALRRMVGGLIVLAGSAIFAADISSVATAHGNSNQPALASN